MADSRYFDLARVLVRYSTNIKPGEKVLVEMIDVPAEFTSILVQEICDAGGLPVVEMKNQMVQRKIVSERNGRKIQVDCRHRT